MYGHDNKVSLVYRHTCWILGFEKKNCGGKDKILSYICHTHNVC